jgi:hypothetical protein
VDPPSTANISIGPAAAGQICSSNIFANLGRKRLELYVAITTVIQGRELISDVITEVVN